MKVVTIMAIRNVVLCEDCRYYIELPDYYFHPVCIHPWVGMEMPHKNDFCSLGELKSDSDNQNMELKKLKDIAIEEYKREDCCNT